MKFTILTPTIGNKNLGSLLESINGQILNSNIELEHYLVIDGQQYKDQVEKVCKQYYSKNRYVICLPHNTGANGYLGHRVYASFPHLINSDYIIFIDDDNSLHNNHIISLYNLIIKDNYDWVYCLRTIIDDNDIYICNDDCESLGYLNSAFYNNNIYFIDTNCTCVRTSICVELCSVWHRKGNNTDEDPDRQYSRLLMSKYPKYECTHLYSLNYRVGTRDGSVKKELFLEGNKVILNNFCGKIPWHNGSKNFYLAHFTYENTVKIINRIYKTKKEDISYNQWQLNILDQMSDYHVLNAYTPYIPSNKKLLVHMFKPELLPECMNRQDIYKIYYTIESPNIRHVAQWDLEFMLNNFNHIITYWKPLLSLGDNFSYFPFIHRFDFYNENDTSNIITNKNNSKNICIILENRPFNMEYSINNIGLKSLDYLRAEYALNLGKRIYCYGDTWEQYSDKVNFCKAKNRFLDCERVVDIMKGYTFVLIIENCNANGYVSEKIYDCLTVGAIPLYYGNNNEILKIPKSCYIDLKNISPSELPSVIDNMSIDFIETTKKNIYKNRLEILYNVSVNNYNKHLKKILDK
jgi:hypothetical protein